jgi:SAM-dependent methyltransferase
MSDADFADHFSGHADEYARYRPTYPPDLFAYLAAQCVAHDLAWDCATGNGQAALGLATHFDRVVATDASAEQIAAAVPHPRVTYAVARARNSPLEDATADLVTVAQALHWIDPDPFFAEVHRVLKPNGVFAAWTYGLFHLAPDDPAADAVDPLIETFYNDRVGPYWPPERRHIEAEYQSLPFPFEERPTPDFTLTMDWELDEVLGYLRTWSATKRYLRDRGDDPVAAMAPDLAGAWGDPATRRTMHWPLHLRVGHRAVKK